MLIADAEAKRAQLLYKTPLGGQMQMYEMYQEMVLSSMKGIEQIVYLPADADGKMNQMALLQAMMANNHAPPPKQ